MMMFHSKGNEMKKYVIATATFFVVGLASAQYAQCWQQYVCGGGGCHWVTLCR
jgi:hypothetical protein